MMEFQFKTVYEPADMAALLYATSYMRWADKPFTRKLWKSRLVLSVLICVIGFAVAVYYTEKQLNIILAAVGLVMFAVGARLARRPTVKSKSTQYLWRMHEPKGIELEFCFAPEQMEFYTGEAVQQHGYDEIVSVLEDEAYFFLCFEPLCVDCVLEKNKMEQGDTDSFRAFIAEKTGKPVEYFK